MSKVTTVERSAVIPAAPERIFPLLEDLRAWERWSPWEELDPNMVHTYSGAERGVGAVHGWTGNSKAGQGRMEITNVDAPRSMEMALEFIKPFKSTNTTRFALAPTTADATTVTWTMESPVTFMTRIAGLFMNLDKRIGGDFEKGLAKLSALAQD